MNTISAAMVELTEMVRSSAPVDRELAPAKKGKNRKPWWNAVLTEVEKERRIITSMLRAMRRYVRLRQQDDWEEVWRHGRYWALEWDRAKAYENGDEGVPRAERKRAEVPRVSPTQATKWRDMMAAAECSAPRLHELSTTLAEPLNGSHTPKPPRGALSKTKKCFDPNPQRNRDFHAVFSGLG